MQARSGLMEWQGGDDEPVFHSIPVNDSASAIMAAFGIAAAVFARERTGEGQRVETSLTNSSVLCQSAELTRYRDAPAMPRGGRDHPGNFALRRLYRCADGWIALAVRSGAQFQAMCVALGHPEWAGRMVAERALSEPADSQLASLIAEALVQLNKDDVVRALLAMDVPAAPALQTLDMFDNPWHLENGFFHQTDHPQFGPMTTVRSYGEFSRTPAGFPRRAPLLAEHAREVLHEIGYDDTAIDGLEQDRAIGRFRPLGG
jgi:crotonobetainyl-CoA:carnitine CoA-transferase CaiB-like acyl-CoA transferase